MPASLVVFTATQWLPALPPQLALAPAPLPAEVRILPARAQCALSVIAR